MDEKSSDVTAPQERKSKREKERERERERERETSLRRIFKSIFIDSLTIFLQIISPSSLMKLNNISLLSLIFCIDARAHVERERERERRARFILT